MIGANLQSIRKYRHLTQEQLAERINVSRQTIAKWESDESSPDLSLAAKLSEVLDVSLDELVLPPVQGAPEGPAPKGKHIFGLVTVSDRGQIVIPIQARRVFHIEAGDQLMVLGDEDQGLALVNARFFLDAMEAMQHVNE